MLSPRNNPNQTVVENPNAEIGNQVPNQEVTNQNQANNIDGIRIPDQSTENQESGNIFSRLRNGVRNLRDNLTSRFREGYNNARNSSIRNEQRRRQQAENAQQNLYDPNYDFEAAVSNPSTGNRRNINLRNEVVGGDDLPPPVRRSLRSIENNNEGEATSTLMTQLAEARRDAPGCDPERARGMIGRLRQRWENMTNVERVVFIGLILIAMGFAAKALPILVAHIVGHMPWLGGVGESAAAIKATLGTGSIANSFGNGAWGTFNYLAANGYPTINMLGSGAKAVSAWHGVGWASASVATLMASLRLGRNNRRVQNQPQIQNNEGNNNPTITNLNVNPANFGGDPFEYAGRNVVEQQPETPLTIETSPPPSQPRPRRYRARRGVLLERADLPREFPIASPTSQRRQEGQSTNLTPDAVRRSNVYSLGRDNIIQDGLLRPHSQVSQNVTPKQSYSIDPETSIPNPTQEENNRPNTSLFPNRNRASQPQADENSQRSTTATLERPRTATTPQAETTSTSENTAEREINFNNFRANLVELASEVYNRGLYNDVVQNAYNNMMENYNDHPRLIAYIQSIAASLRENRNLDGGDPQRISEDNERMILQLSVNTNNAFLRYANTNI
jgi:hypothetical protein